MFDVEDGSCDCGGHAVKRHNSKTGEPFWGCSNFPKCRNTERYPHSWSNQFHGHDMMTSQEELECWAEAMTWDCGFKD